MHENSVSCLQYLIIAQKRELFRDPRITPQLYKTDQEMSTIGSMTSNRVVYEPTTAIRAMVINKNCILTELGEK